MSRTKWCSALLCAAGLAVSSAWADPIITSGTDGQGKATPKSGGSREFVDYPKPDKKNEAKGTIQTTFKFHQERAPKDEITKYCEKGKESVDKPKVRHEYGKGELHDTVGAVDYNVSLVMVTKPDPKTPGKFIDQLETRVSSKGEIIPGSKGKNGGAVSIEASFKDPFTFSDDNTEANYKSFEQGMDLSVDLGTDTFFPTDLGPDGSLAEGAYKAWRGRVAPGLVSDPTAFWDAPTPGAIDLYTLTLTIDSSHQVHADLWFGESNEFFSVDVTDGSGNIVAPEDLEAFSAAMEALIAANFVNGALMMPLEGLFSAGFVPTSLAMGDYTAGTAGSQAWNGLEPVPGPATLGAAAMCLLMGGRRRR